MSLQGFVKRIEGNREFSLGQKAALDDPTISNESYSYDNRMV